MVDCNSAWGLCLHTWMLRVSSFSFFLDWNTPNSIPLKLRCYFYKCFLDTKPSSPSAHLTWHCNFPKTEKRDHAYFVEKTRESESEWSHCLLCIWLFNTCVEIVPLTELCWDRGTFIVLSSRFHRKLCLILWMMFSKIEHCKSIFIADHSLNETLRGAQVPGCVALS